MKSLPETVMRHVGSETDQSDGAELVGMETSLKLWLLINPSPLTSHDPCPSIPFPYRVLTCDVMWILLPRKLYQRSILGLMFLGVHDNVK
jgi:hypothetical protein